MDKKYGLLIKHPDALATCLNQFVVLSHEDLRSIVQLINATDVLHSHLSGWTRLATMLVMDESKKVDSQNLKGTRMVGGFICQAELFKVAAVPRKAGEFTYKARLFNDAVCELGRYTNNVGLQVSLTSSEAPTTTSEKSYGDHGTHPHQDSVKYRGSKDAIDLFQYTVDTHYQYQGWLTSDKVQVSEVLQQLYTFLDESRSKYMSYSSKLQPVNFGSKELMNMIVTALAIHAIHSPQVHLGADEMCWLPLVVVLGLLAVIVSVLFGLQRMKLIDCSSMLRRFTVLRYNVFCKYIVFRNYISFKLNSALRLIRRS